MSVKYVEDREAENFLADLASAMEELAERSRAAGRQDMALAASDVGDALYVLLDVTVKMTRETVPYREF